jgi:hypothetical protein
LCVRVCAFMCVRVCVCMYLVWCVGICTRHIYRCNTHKCIRTRTCIYRHASTRTLSSTSSCCRSCSARLPSSRARSLSSVTLSSSRFNRLPYKTTL